MTCRPRQQQHAGALPSLHHPLAPPPAPRAYGAAGMLRRMRSHSTPQRRRRAPSARPAPRWPPGRWPCAPRPFPSCSAGRGGARLYIAKLVYCFQSGWECTPGVEGASPAPHCSIFRRERAVQWLHRQALCMLRRRLCSTSTAGVALPARPRVRAACADLHGRHHAPPRRKRPHVVGHLHHTHHLHSFQRLQTQHAQHRTKCFKGGIAARPLALSTAAAQRLAGDAQRLPRAAGAGAGHACHPSTDTVSW